MRKRHNQKKDSHLSLTRNYTCIVFRGSRGRRSPKVMSYILELKIDFRQGQKTSKIVNMQEPIACDARDYISVGKIM